MVISPSTMAYEKKLTGIMVEMKKSAQGHIDKIVTVRPNMKYVTARILMQATPEYLATHKSEPIAWQSPRYEVFTICSS